jgi:hypothetical protein
VAGTLQPPVLPSGQAYPENAESTKEMTKRDRPLMGFLHPFVDCINKGEYTIEYIPTGAMVDEGDRRGEASGVPCDEGTWIGRMTRSRDLCGKVDDMGVQGSLGLHTHSCHPGTRLLSSVHTM